MRVARTIWNLFLLSTWRAGPSALSPLTPAAAAPPSPSQFPNFPIHSEKVVHRCAFVEQVEFRKRVGLDACVDATFHF